MTHRRSQCYFSSGFSEQKKALLYTKKSWTNIQTYIETLTTEYNKLDVQEANTPKHAFYSPDPYTSSDRSEQLMGIERKHFSFQVAA